MGNFLMRIRRSGSRYFRHPILFVRYGEYLLETVHERWPKKEKSIYVLDMKLPKSKNATSPEVQRIASLEPLEEFIQLREQEDPVWRGNYANELKERFSRGNICFAALKEGNIVSTLFVTFGEYYFAELDYRIKFPKRVLGVIDVYTLKAYQGRGYYKMIFNACAEYFVGPEYRILYGFIEPSNKVSLRTHDRVGLNHIIMEISMHQRWGFRWHTIKHLDTFIERIL